MSDKNHSLIKPANSSGTQIYRRLKYCTACSCFFACDFVVNVPRFLRLPVFGFFFREYNRYFPDFSFLIISIEYSQTKWTLGVEF